MLKTFSIPEIPRRYQMTTRTVAKKSTAKASNAPILKDLSLQLLTADQFEAITKANYYHPDSRLVLQLFLHVNYSWHLARNIQNKPSSLGSIDWVLYEKNAEKLIAESLSKLLSGISPEPWNLEAPAPVPASKPQRKTRAVTRQACGCSQQHSQAAGVVAACQLGKAQGQDESWTGY
jgi:hypothetical protein